MVPAVHTAYGFVKVETEAIISPTEEVRSLIVKAAKGGVSSVLKGQVQATVTDGVNKLSDGNFTAGIDSIKL